MKNVVSLLLGLILTSAVGAQSLSEIPVGGQLTDIYMRGLTTSPGMFSNFQGKPLIINVWASYCSPCLKEMASLENLYQHFKGNVQMIGISIDDYPERAFGFLNKTDTSFQHYIDYQLELETMLGANTIPLTVFVDKNGIILRKVRGAQEWDSVEQVHSVKTLFAAH
ncbi:TlpA disulfide reductase family protein [Reinekea sp. G2M2-21]|uniref:TlpA family protein disulfide reductase n=1 Tax=Reinekea sp. G2M2-21 TaxID=2788942 RepID=UPI0018AC0A81|nr:TlpA disulfide reductase family protein [Reinekea sp. G2M2-21]